MRAVFVAYGLVALGIGVFTANRDVNRAPAAYSETEATREDGAGARRSKGVKHLSRHADWRLLFFHPRSNPNEPPRVIKAIEIEWRLWKEEVRIRSEDRKILEAVQVALDIPFRRAVPDDGSYEGTYGVGNIGTIWITATDGKFMLGVNFCGFALNARDADNNNSFFSWLLAKQLDQLLFEQTGKHLPERIFDGLSGEYKYKMQKMWWEKHRLRAQNENKSTLGSAVEQGH